MILIKLMSINPKHFSCIINDIKKGEKTVMIPCGHLLHWKCGLLWLRKNNTCPVCRFELPGEKYHH